MPLLDHFRPPMPPWRQWQSFALGWSVEMVAGLNLRVLTEEHRAEPVFWWGSKLKVDASPPQEAEAALVMPAAFPDAFGLHVYATEGGPTLVGAVQIVGPRNKERPDVRRGFAARVATHLQAGVGVIVIDVVTGTPHNLHDELVRLLGYADALLYPTASPLYAVAYRPSGDQTEARVEVWPFDLTVGQALPTVPLPLRNGPTVPLELERSYQEARVSLRL